MLRSLRGWSSLFLIGVIFLVSILFRYLYFLDIKSHKVYEVEGKIVAEYKKKNYYVLKIKTPIFTFYTTTREDLKDILNYDVNLKIITKNIKFKDFLFTFYAPSFDIKIWPLSEYKKYIISQHQDKIMANLFLGLFFADSLYYDLRQYLSSLGIAHLLALSGFHLGFLSLVLYFLFGIIYDYFHRFFPYRNKYIDLGFLVLGSLFFYLWFVGFPASLVRSYIMMSIFFLLAFYLMDIFNIRVLIFTALLGIAIFPSFIKSIGFFLSIMGVFYIFVFFRYFKANFVNTILMSFYLYIQMLIISHYFFGNFSYYSIFSPIVTILFSIFYPLEIFLHIINEGGILDGFINKYLLLGKEYKEIYAPFWLFLLDIVLSILAYFKKEFFVLAFLLNLGFLIYMGVYN